MCANHQHPSSTATVAPEAVASHCCAHTVAATAPLPSAVPTQPAQDEIAECPVMPGSVVNKADAEAAGLYRDYAGNRYWFCCAACGPMWDADPAKYAAA